LKDFPDIGLSTMVFQEVYINCLYSSRKHLKKFS